MPRKVVRKDLSDLAEELMLKQKSNQSMVLFLGSRAGGLFRSEGFFDMMKQISISSFGPLSRENQFAECYRLLKHDRFNDNNIHSLFVSSLKNVTFSEADIYLAEFIKNGLFDVVISTNVDGILEQALEEVDMRELYDFEVLIPNRKSSKADKQPTCLVVKVFGDIYFRVYNITRRDFYLDSLPELKGRLETILARDVLMIGFDPIWDSEVLRVFTGDKEDQESFLWLVAEETLVKHQLVSRTLRRRRTIHIAWKNGGYEQFLKALYMYFYDKMPMHHQSMHDISNSLKHLHREVQAIHREILALQEKLDR